MTAAISFPVRMVTLLGLLAAVGLAAFLFVLRPGADGEAAASTPSTTRAPAVTKPATTPKTVPAAKKPTAIQAKSGIPAAIERALRRHRVVVVPVYTPGVAIDATVREEARAGAAIARAGYVAVSALSERLVRPLVAKTGVLPQPAVLIVRRPGRVVATLGVADRETVAAAVAQAR